MRQEKEYLVNEVEKHLSKSDYVFITAFNRLTVADVADLRNALLKEGDANVEYHVVKNSVLRHAAERLKLPNFDEALGGHTAIIVGGENPSGVAKVLTRFQKEKEEKIKAKVGIISNKKISTKEIAELATLPSLDVLRAQLLGLFNTPAQQMVRVLIAVPEGMLNVLQAKSKQD